MDKPLTLADIATVVDVRVEAAVSRMETIAERIEADAARRDVEFTKREERREAEDARRDAEAAKREERREAELALLKERNDAELALLKEQLKTEAAQRQADSSRRETRMLLWMGGMFVATATVFGVYQELHVLPRFSATATTQPSAAISTAAPTAAALAATPPTQ